MTFSSQRRPTKPTRAWCVVVVFGALVGLPAAGQVEDQASWDAAYANAYPAGDPFHDGPWRGFGPADPSGMFGQVFAWKAHFILRAYLTMAETYGDEVYLDRAVALIDEMLLQRDDRRVERGELDLLAEPYLYAPSYYLQPENRHVGAKGWRSPVGDQIRIEALSDGQICDAIMRFVDLVEKDDRFAAYRRNVPRYIDDVSETVAMHDSSFVFDRFPGVHGIYYYPKPDGSGLHAGSLPLNHNFVVLRAALLLDEHSDDVVHRPKVEAFLRYFWSITRLAGITYEWDYDPRGASTAPEDFGHGAIDITSLILAHGHGLVDSVCMVRFARTFTDNLYRGNGDTARHVDGTGEEFDSHHAAIGWIELARFDPAVLDIAIDVLTDDDPMPNWSKPLLGWAEILRVRSRPGDYDDDAVADDDNCPFLSNSEQLDADHDGVGDDCDVCPQDRDVSREGFNFQTRFGTSGTAAGQFNDPKGIAVSAIGLTYVSDTWNHRIQVFDEFGRLQFVIGRSGSEAGEFRAPRGLALDASGRLYVADSRNDRVQVFDAQGAFVLAFGEPGSAPGQFNRPIDVAIGPDGRVYVAEAGNHRFQLFSADGEFLEVVTGVAPLSNPQGIAVDGAGRVYVSGNRRVLALTPGDWQLAYEFDGLHSPIDVAVDPVGNVVVTDLGTHSVVGLDVDGQQTFRLDEPQLLAFGVRQPEGVAIDAAGRIWVTHRQDGVATIGMPADADADEAPDCVDRCPDGDFDDFDDDLVCGVLDNCPDVSNPAQEDDDHDGVGNSCDVCPSDPALSVGSGNACNPVCDAAPGDPDDDALCAAIDNCTTAANADQLDLDLDGSGDACDNCPATVNPAQDDADRDGFGDACDCASGNPNAGSVPPIVRDVRFLTSRTLAWLSLSAEAGVGTTYRVTRGMISDLTAGPTETFGATYGLAPRLHDPALPPLNAAFYYLVQGTNACGDGPARSDP